MLQHGFKQGDHVVRVRFVQVQLGKAIQCGGVDDREIELLIGRAKFVEEVKGLVHHPVRA
jgi:hypothetical protein